MGMDVIGKHPVSERGEYFRNNVWWWRPLWNYCEDIGRDIIPEDNLGHTNDGWGLCSEDSIELARLLQEEIDSGRCLIFEKGYEQDRKHTPRQECSWCNGTGVRTDKVGVECGMTNKPIEDPNHPRYGQKGTCNGCNGEGKVVPYSAQYPFSTENVQNFVHFLENCGGFDIC